MGLIALIVALPVAAWGMWLAFCYAIARRHGVEALKAAPPIAKAFPVSAWVASLRHVGPWIADLLGRNQPPALPPAQQPPHPPGGPPP
jgi:hypothetical protein